MHTATLLLGGNVGDRFLNLQQAIELIEKKAGSILHKSQVYETAAWGNIEQAAFLNQATVIKTTWQPHQLLKIILQIELSLGRQRTIKYAPRTMDIDIIFYDNLIIHKKKLTIPHPHAHERRFVLMPLAEILPQFVHPLMQKTITQLFEVCPDPLPVHKYITAQQ
jgi:2-amino-4-hydroxy-6-hydroxymethyldihydropteridine diphosphokinase